MNYSRKKSDGVFSKLFSSAIKSVLLLFAAILLVGGYTPQADSPVQDTVSDTPEADYSVEQPAESVEEDDFSFINPTEGVLTSPFGERHGRMHNGIDIGADTDTEIYAANDGIISFAGVVNGYGNYVVIDHDNGYQTSYAHCNSILVSNGDSVTKGQVIALVGSTGNSTGPHLHFEIKVNGEFSDPLDYVLY